MTFEVLPALVAGFVATVVMSAMMTMAARANMTQMPPMTLVTGSMMTSDPYRARTMGIVIHYIVMGTVAFGLIYAGVFAGVGSASALTGLLVGAVHGVVVGAMAMPMMPAMHPRMATVPESGPSGTEGGTVTLSKPGFFGANWGGMTPVGLLAGHLVYGLVLALVYSALV
ncbi:MAG: DUF6789 family protein [Actinomycetota bacterium]